MSRSNEISLWERIRLNLVHAMEKEKISQVQLAERLGISKGTVNNWTRGNNSPDVDMVPKICQVLGISIVSLYSPAESENISSNQETLTVNIPAVNNPAASLSDDALEVAHAYSSATPEKKKIVRLALELDKMETAEELPPAGKRA